MPAQWTGELIGKMHNAGIKKKELAAHLGLHEKYVSAVLNGKDNPKNAEQRFNDAYTSLVANKNAPQSGA